MSLRKTSRAARNALRAYDADTAAGRDALQRLDAEGLAQLRMLNTLSPGAELVLFGTLPLAALCLLLLVLTGFGYAVARESLPAAIVCTICAIASPFVTRLADVWEPSVTTLAVRLRPLAENASACQRVRDLALTHTGAKAYRDEVVSRRELVSLDLMAMQALERASRHATWLDIWTTDEAARKQAQARLVRQAHGEAVLD